MTESTLISDDLPDMERLVEKITFAHPIATYIVRSEDGFKRAVGDYLALDVLTDGFDDDADIQKFYPAVVTFDTRYNGGGEMTYIAKWETLQDAELRCRADICRIRKHSHLT